MSNDLSRRTFLLGASAGAATAAFGLRPVAAIAAGAAPGPAPSMTTTSGKPQLLAAHCCVLGAPMAQPVVRAETMQVAAVISEPAMVKVRAWAAATPDHVVESLWTPTATGLDASNPVNVAKLRMAPGTGAAPGEWQWRTYVAKLGTAPTAPVSAAYSTDGAVRVVPARPTPGATAALSVAAGSCTQIAHPGQPNRPIVSAASIAAARPAFFVHMGDTSYVDTWNEYLQDTPNHLYTKFATGMRRHFLQPDLVSLYNKTQVRMVIDDHDSGPDNSYAANVYPQARQVLTDIAAGTSFDNARYDLIHPAAPTYDTWASGQAQFWLLDNRLWRDTPGTRPQSFHGQGYASQLGATQRAWLLSGLASSDAPVKIIFSPRTFKQFYAPAEQEEILDWITGRLSGAPKVNGTVVFVTGDMHAGAVWKLSPTRPVYELLCGPIYNTGYHTPTALTDWQVAWGYQTRFLNTVDGKPGRAISCAWGRLDIGADASVTVNLLRDDGTSLYREHINP